MRRLRENRENTRYQGAAPDGNSAGNSGGGLLISSVLRMPRRGGFFLDTAVSLVYYTPKIWCCGFERWGAVRWGGVRGAGGEGRNGEVGMEQRDGIQMEEPTGWAIGVGRRGANEANLPGVRGAREIRNPTLSIRNEFEMPRTETSRSAPNEANLPVAEEARNANIEMSNKANFGVLGSKTRIGVEGKANLAVGRGRRRLCLCSQSRSGLGAAGFGGPAFPGGGGPRFGRARAVAGGLSF